MSEPKNENDDPYKAHKIRVRSDVTISTWRNLPGEVNAGYCARLEIKRPGIGAWGCADPRAALEGVARDLEMLAAEIRRLAERS